MYEAVSKVYENDFIFMTVRMIYISEQQCYIKFYNMRFFKLLLKFLE